MKLTSTSIPIIQQASTSDETLPPCASNVSFEEEGESKIVPPEMNGVSVHHLMTVMKDEVEKFQGYDDDDDNKSDDRKKDLDKRVGTKRNIYDLEDLDKKSGLIRLKGESVQCPRDGRMGAAYVDCLRGDDHVGPANVMLSYTWGNTFEDIVDVLVRYCEKQNLQLNRTYVWICCLCVNQHRVVEGNNAVSFEELRKIFKSKVVGIGEVVSLLTPWDGPKYLTRVWCIFELFTAANAALDGLSCQLHIEMPRSTENEFRQFLYSTDSPMHFMIKIYEVLGNTKIEDAQASIEKDKENILKLVEQGGGCEALNNAVNDLLRNWIRNVLLDVYNQVITVISNQDHNVSSFRNEEGKNMDVLEKEQIVNCFFNIGKVFHSNGQVDLALECHTICHKYCLQKFGEYHTQTASALHALANIYSTRKEYDKAIDCGLKCLKIKEKCYGENDLETATTYYTLGSTYHDKKDYEEAFTYYEKALRIREEKLHDEGRIRTANVYHDIGYLCYERNDYIRALDYYTKAKKIKEELAESNNGYKPSLANTINKIGLVHGCMGDKRKQLKFHHKALEINKNIQGEDHPSTKQTYQYISEAKEKLNAENTARCCARLSSLFALGNGK